MPATWRHAADRSARVSELRRHRSAFVALVVLAVLSAACSSASHTAAAKPPVIRREPASAAGLPPIRHVFVIMLENEGYPATFGNPAADPYLATTLPAQGALLKNYFATGHFSNDNYISFISGQAPNPSNQTDCQVFNDFPPNATIAADGQISGSGCVYPSSITTVANQLTSAGLSWKGYMQGMGNVPSRESATCAHPPVGAKDGTQKAFPGDGYATRHDPFVYFHSIIDNAAYCSAHVVPLGSTTGAMPTGVPSGTVGLAKALKSVATTPNFSFITPNLCNDGHDFPCVNQTGKATALANIDAFLSTWVPLITHSPAFKKNGLLEVTFDEGATQDSRACCNEVAGPGTTKPGFFGPGGGQTGTVLISPFIHPGTVSTVAYNHYSSLATIEDLFGLAKLGEAKTVSSTFGKDIFSAKR